jgi:hypothetical protein
VKSAGCLRWAPLISRTMRFIAMRAGLCLRYTLVASSLRPHTLVASSVRPHTLVASSFRPHALVASGLRPHTLVFLFLQPQNGTQESSFHPQKGTHESYTSGS